MDYTAAREIFGLLGPLYISFGFWAGVKASEDRRYAWIFVAFFALLIAIVALITKDLWS